MQKDFVGLLRKKSSKARLGADFFGIPNKLEINMSLTVAEGVFPRHQLICCDEFFRKLVSKYLFGGGRCVGPYYHGDVSRRRRG